MDAGDLPMNGSFIYKKVRQSIKSGCQELGVGEEKFKKRGGRGIMSRKGWEDILELIS